MHELPTEKSCSRCGEIKAAGDFGIRIEFGRAYLRSACRACHRQRAATQKRGEYVPDPPREKPAAGYKFCKSCDQSLPVGAFGKNRRSPDGLGFYCKECGAFRQQLRLKGMSIEEYRAHRERQAQSAKRCGWKRRHNLRQYNLTADQADAMYAEQGGLCAICGKPEMATRNGSALSLSIDHDRSCCPGFGSCGRCVRSLLCGNCNKGLGCFKDSPALLRAAIDYLARHQETTGSTARSEKPIVPASA